MRNIYKHWISHLLRLVITSGCSLGTGDWRIHHLPGRILRQMFGSLWLFFIQTNENPVIYDKLEYRQRDDWHQGRDFFFLTKHGLEKMFEIILDGRVQNKITAFSLNLWAFVVKAYFSRLSIMNEHIPWIVNNVIYYYYIIISSLTNQGGAQTWQFRSVKQYEYKTDFNLNEWKGFTNSTKQVFVQNKS